MNRLFAILCVLFVVAIAQQQSHTSFGISQIAVPHFPDRGTFDVEIAYSATEKAQLLVEIVDRDRDYSLHGSGAITVQPGSASTKVKVSIDKVLPNREFMIGVSLVDGEDHTQATAEFNGFPQKGNGNNNNNNQGRGRRESWAINDISIASLPVTGKFGASITYSTTEKSVIIISILDKTGNMLGGGEKTVLPGARNEEIMVTVDKKLSTKASSKVSAVLISYSDNNKAKRWTYAKATADWFGFPKTDSIIQNNKWKLTKVRPSEVPFEGTFDISFQYISTTDGEIDVDVRDSRGVSRGSGELAITAGPASKGYRTGRISVAINGRLPNQQISISTRLMKKGDSTTAMAEADNFLTPTGKKVWRNGGNNKRHSWGIDSMKVSKIPTSGAFPVVVQYSTTTPAILIIRVQETNSLKKIALVHQQVKPTNGHHITINIPLSSELDADTSIHIKAYLVRKQDVGNKGEHQASWERIAKASTEKWTYPSSSNN